jgi:hypothetical protein
MATYIRVDVENDDILQRNRQQTAVNRSLRLETRRQGLQEAAIVNARAAVAEPEPGRIGRLRRREGFAFRRPAPKYSYSYCVLEIIGNQKVTGELPISGLLPGDEIFYPNSPSHNYTARVDPNSVGVSATFNLRLATALPNDFIAVYRLMTIGQLLGVKPPGIPESQEYLSTELVIPAADPRSSILYPSSIFVINWETDKYTDIFGNNYWIPRVVTVNRGPYSVFAPVSINIYPTQSKTIENLIYGATEQIKRAELANIMNKSTLEGTKQSKEASYNITEQDTRIPSVLPPQTLGVLKGNRYFFEYILQ